MFKITSSNKEVQAEYDILHTRINLLEKSKDKLSLLANKALQDFKNGNTTDLKF